MDLGIRGKKAIVCASSRGLGKGCAIALAEAGCDLVVNGRNAAHVGQNRRRFARAFRRQGAEIVGDVSNPRSRRRCLPPVPTPTFSSKQWRPAAARFPRTRPRGDPRRRHPEYGHADRTHSGGDRRHGRARLRPHREHHLAFGLCAHSRARLSFGARAGLTSFLAGVARTVIDKQCDHQQYVAWQTRHRPAAPSA